MHLRLLTCLLLTATLCAIASPFSWSEQEAVSILRPAVTSAQEYRFKIDAIDPSASTNVPGAQAPGFRGEDQLIIYTPAFGSVTGTNQAGFEAVVVNQTVTQTGSGNLNIPSDGFVISAHGAAAQWLVRFAKPGAVVSYDATTKQISIRHTTQVYVNDVALAISRAQSRPAANAEHYQKYLEQAQSCQAKLDKHSQESLSPEYIALAEQCIKSADLAFYNTIPNIPGEFRGTWLRPANAKPEDIRRTVSTLKQLGIQNVFLETYYQGSTTYPSDVMAEYGLPLQHPQFQGTDPLKSWIDEAHAQGLKVHIWTEVFFAGNSQENAELYGPILQKYPQWRNVQKRHVNSTIPVISDVEPGHYFVDPANPEVRTFLEKLFLEIVTKYDVDGLSLDYIRYPASAAVTTPNYLNSTWGYTDYARKTFMAMIQKERDTAEAAKLEALKKTNKAKYYKAPNLPSADPVTFTPSNPLWPRWIEWRKSMITSFVKNIAEKAHAIRPNLLVSAVVFPSKDATYALKLQDYPYWAQEGYIQALTPIGLSPRPDLMYQQSLQLKHQVQNKVPIYVGIFGMYNRNTPVELVQQIDAVHRAEMPGVMMFEWSRIRPEYTEALIEGPFRK